VSSKSGRQIENQYSPILEITTLYSLKSWKIETKYKMLKSECLPINNEFWIAIHIPKSPDIYKIQETWKSKKP